MKKKYVLLLAVAISLTAMSFRTSPDFEKNLSANKVEITQTNNKSVNLSSSETALPPAVALVYVALAETSAAAVVVSAAAVYNWLFGATEQLAILKDYKSVLQEIDMRKLDNRN